MMCVYDRVYLDRARANLGRMLDFAVYDLQYDLTAFVDLFLASGLAERFGKGDYSLITGMSGVELAYKVLEENGVVVERKQPRYTANRSEEYWVGWALAYYQWETGLSFEEIIRYIPIQKILALYSPYHEMDIRQFSDRMNELYKQAKPVTNLKIFRQRAGLSQKELSELSGVPLRTLQQYEQRQKNINKSQVEYLVRFSNALHCDIEVLIERVE